MFAWLLAVPALIKLLVSLAVILALNAWRANLTVATLVGCLVLGLWSGHPWLADGGPSHGMLLIAWERLVSRDNLLLGAVIFLVIWLSGAMKSSGVMADLVSCIRARVPRRGAMAALPAVIGFLPMPGGAIFSAPLVDECDPASEVAGLVKSRTNYWFRHLWEYWWPLYPGVLLAIEISGVATWRFMLLMLPLSLASMVVGWAFLLRRIPHETDGSRPASTAGRRPGFVALVAPILVVIVVYALIHALLPAIAAFSRYLPMVIGLMVALAVLSWQRRLGWRAWQPLLINRKTILLVALVFVIRIYGAYIDATGPDGHSLVEAVRGDLVAWGIPIVAMIMILPFLIGLVTGVAVGMVGGSFPIVMNLIGADPDPALLLATVVLAYGCGYLGMILSPVHVCLIVTNEHFKTRLQHSIAGLVAPCAVMLAVIVGYWLAVRSLIPVGT